MCTNMCTNGRPLKSLVIIWQSLTIAEGMKNGEGGIRTPGTLACTLVFETSQNLTKTPENIDFSDSPPTVAPPVGGQSPDDPELIYIIAAWSELPRAIRAGILAMVDAVRSRGGEQ